MNNLNLKLRIKDMYFKSRLEIQGGDQGDGKLRKS